MAAAETLLDRLKRLVPSREQLAENRWLRWIGPALFHPRLWHVSRRGVALGVAIGIFFGLLIPIAQIPISAAVAVAMRANLPAAMASTLVTNPVTFPPVYFAAWKLGSALLGEEARGPGPMPPQGGDTLPPAVSVEAGSWWATAWHNVSQVGRALLLGLVVFAVGAGLGTYFLINLFWHLRVRLKRRKRMRTKPI
ncbi:MAG: DUF2062 domain-containing protein [Rubrivivax sp.]|nr:DUF2062 domain-containing protein [Rubrivivax sp.]MDP3610963.1 DUF2062 domain-containing protein [Rubrivivax sp.]